MKYGKMNLLLTPVCPTIGCGNDNTLLKNLYYCDFICLCMFECLGFKVLCKWRVFFYFILEGKYKRRGGG